MSLFGGVSGGGSGTGTPGADGNTVLYGAGAPTSGLGVNGNFYIDTTAHAIYGPKTGGSWGAGTSMAGTNGIDGDQVIYGSGAPSNATGNNGDTYIDSVGHVLYGPKASGAWPAGTSLVGPTGDAPLIPILVFGNGSDGNITMSSGSITLSRDMYYNNLTLSGTAQINTLGYRIFVAGTLDISNAGANALNNNGGQASLTQAGTTSAISTPPPGQQATVLGGGTGSSSGAGSLTVGNQSGNPSLQTNAMGGGGGQGGAGGASGTGNAGGAARSGASAIGGGNNNIRRLQFDFMRMSSPLVCGAAGAGGSSGGGDGTNTSNAGAACGVPAGMIWVAAKTINRGASTAVGAIAAKGSNGGQFASAVTTGNCGGYGGGGGGGGGWVYLVYQTLTGAQATNALSADGGDGSTGGNAAGTGKGGQGGQGGFAGRITVVDLTAQTVTQAIDPANSSTPSIPAAPSTAIGSAGSSGAQARVNL